MLTDKELRDMKRNCQTIRKKAIKLNDIKTVKECDYYICKYMFILIGRHERTEQIKEIMKRIESQKFVSYTRKWIQLNEEIDKLEDGK